MKTDLSDTPLTPDTLRILRDKNAIDAETYWRGIQELRPPTNWVKWSSGFFLTLGVALLLSGIVFFFAYNWQDLHRGVKLGLPQSLTLAALIAAQRFGLRQLCGQLCLLSAATFTGVCFAAYGQVYQTGADAFGFFGIWALTISPWVMTAHFAPLWILWLALINLTGWFFWDQVGQFRHTLDYPLLTLALAGINGLALFLAEFTCHQYAWLQQRWLRPLLLLASLVPLIIPVLGWIVSFGRTNTESVIFITALIIWSIVSAGLYRLYNFKRFDATQLTFILVQCALVLLFLIGRLLAEGLENDWIGYFFLMALATIGLSTALLFYIRKRIRETTTTKEFSR